MARVRILTSISTTVDSYKRGQEVDLDEATARSWVEAGMAVPAGNEEQTVPETTARRTGRPTSRKPKGRE